MNVPSIKNDNINNEKSIDDIQEIPSNSEKEIISNKSNNINLNSILF